MKKRRQNGRKPAWYIDAALAVIMGSDEPVSTFMLIDRLDLDENEGINLRRGLRRAEDEKVIQRVAGHPDGSFAWLPKNVSIEVCACHTANLFLAGKDSPFQIDPEKFADWIRAEGLI